MSLGNTHFSLFNTEYLNNLFLIINYLEVSLIFNIKISVFNVDNTDIGKKTCNDDQLDSIKSRLRSARKKGIQIYPQ